MFFGFDLKQIVFKLERDNKQLLIENSKLTGKCSQIQHDILAIQKKFEEENEQKAKYYQSLEKANNRLKEKVISLSPKIEELTKKLEGKYIYLSSLYLKFKKHFSSLKINFILKIKGNKN